MTPPSPREAADPSTAEVLDLIGNVVALKASGNSSDRIAGDVLTALVAGGFRVARATAPTGPASRCREAADRMDAWWRENDTEDFGTPDQWTTDLELLIACGRRPAPTGPGQGGDVAPGTLLDAIGNAVYEAGVGRAGPDPTWKGVAEAAHRAARAWFARTSAPGEAKRARVELTCGGAADEGDCTWRRGPVEVLDPTLPPCADCGHIQANHHIHRHPDGDGEWIECAAGCRCEDWRPRDARAHGIAIDAIEDRVGATGDPELAQWVASAVEAMLATGWTPPPGEQSVYEDRDAAPGEAAETEGGEWPEHPSGSLDERLRLVAADPDLATWQRDVLAEARTVLRRHEQFARVRSVGRPAETGGDQR